MPRRRNTQQQEDSQVAPRLSASDSGPTLTLKLDEDGAVDWGRTKESSKEKFKAILSSDPTALEMVADVLKDVEDEGGDSVDVDVPHLTAENVGAFIDQVNLGCGAGMALLVGKFKKHPVLRTPQGQPVKMVISPEVLLHTTQLTPKQHEELDPRALKIANKYADKIPDAIKAHLDIWLLGIMFLKYQAQNFSKMIATQVALDIKATIQQKQVTPKPIPPDSDKANGQATVSPPPSEERGGETLEPGFIPPNLDEGTPRV